MGVVADVQVKVNAAVVADADAAVAAAAGLRLMGWAARETAAAAASGKIVHGATVGTGTVLVPFAFAANGCAGDWYGPLGIPAASGLSIDHVAGSFDLTMFYRVVS